MGTSYSITNYSDEALMVMYTSSPGPARIVGLQETIQITQGAVLSIDGGTWSLDKALKDNNFDSFYDHKKALDKSNAILGNSHMVYIDNYGNIKVIEIIVPISDTTDYGHITKVGIDQCIGTNGDICNPCPITVNDQVYENKSSKSFFMPINHHLNANIFKIPPGYRTKYSGKWCSLTANVGFVHVTKLSTRIIKNDPYCCVHISNRSNDYVTCQTSGSSVMIPPKSFQECFSVTSILTYKGNRLQPILPRKKSQIVLDDYIFDINSKTDITQIVIESNIGG